MWFSDRSLNGKYEWAGWRVRQDDLNMRQGGEVTCNAIMVVRLVGMCSGMAQRQRLNEDEQGCEEGQSVCAMMPGGHGYSITFS
jgi:hypothetical protein